MSINQFLTRENAKLLWEVLMDDEILSNKPREFIIQLNGVFNQNIVPFFEHEKKNTYSLVELNKKFIALMIQFVNKNYTPNQNQNQNQNQDNGNGNGRKPLIRSEDIKADRISQFDKDLQLRQQDFTSAMSLPVPPKPKFNDEYTDEPIGENIEEIIRQTVAMRNYDVGQLNKKYDPNQASEWLKPSETSIKKPPQGIQNTRIRGDIDPALKSGAKNPDSNTNTGSNKIKYIRIENDELDNTIIDSDIVDINNHNLNAINIAKKQISWADEGKKKDVNIFSKLKHIPVSNTNETTSKMVSNVEDREKVEYKYNKNDTDEKIRILENKMDMLQNKMDIILNLIQNNSTSNNTNNNIENIQLEIIS